jgi:hypothetical protein
VGGIATHRNPNRPFLARRASAVHTCRAPSERNPDNRIARTAALEAALFAAGLRRTLFERV